MRNAITDFLFHCRIEKKLSEKTIKAYETDLKQFKEFLQCIDLNRIGKKELKSYFLHISPLAPKTMKRKIATLKVFFSYLEFEDLLSQNPFRKVRIKIKDDILLPKTMSIREVEQILKKVYNLKNRLINKNSFKYYESVRNIAIIELLFATGIRVSELCYIKALDINQDYSLVKIFGKGNKERTIPITNEATQRALKENYRCFRKSIETNDFIFVNRLGCRLSQQSVRFLVKKLAQETNIKRHITPHIFRHTFATLLLEGDTDIRYIQHLLGHSSIAVTQIYTHVNERKKKDIMILKNPRNMISLN